MEDSRKQTGGKNTYSSKSSPLLQNGNCRSFWAANILSDISRHNFHKTQLRYYLKAEFRFHVDIIFFSRSNINNKIANGVPSDEVYEFHGFF
jgi:hypothetical protein